MNITPSQLPRVEGQTHWNDLSGIQQADILTFDQIRQHDNEEWDSKLAGAGMPKVPKGKKPRKR